MRRRAENERAGTRKHGTEVGHRADANEYQARINTSLDADVKHIEQAALLQNVEIIHSFFNSLGSRPPFGVENFVAVERGKVCEKHAERNAHKKQRLELLFDAEIKEYERNYNHDDVLPTACLAEEVIAAAIPYIF